MGADFELLADFSQTEGAPGAGSYFHAHPDPNLSGDPMQYREMYLLLREEE